MGVATFKTASGAGNEIFRYGHTLQGIVHVSVVGAGSGE